MQRIDTHPMTLIDLIRHGMPVGGRRYRGHIDDELSDEGWRQMWGAVGAHCPWDAIVTSPLKRCRAFAEALGRDRSRPVEIESGFKEIHFGAWEGRHVRDILAESPAEVEGYWRNPVEHTPPEAESLDAFRTRAVRAWDDVAARHAGRHVLIVGHGGLIRTLLTQVLTMPLRSVLRLEVPNAGLTRVRLQEDVNGEPAPSLVFHARQTLS